jgi:hypothetical protein
MAKVNLFGQRLHRDDDVRDSQQLIIHLRASRLNDCKTTAHQTLLTVQTEQETLQNKKKIDKTMIISNIKRKTKECST